MKSIFYTLVILITPLITYSQEASYQFLENGKDISKGPIETYIAKDGSVYKIGDKLKLGKPSAGMAFTYITEGDGLLLPVEQLSSRAAGTQTEIKGMRVGGTKKSGYRVWFKTKASAVSFYVIDFENAVDVGEVLSFGLSSDEALAELKKAKDKLDLGVITADEYEEIKKELIKFIK